MIQQRSTQSVSSSQKAPRVTSGHCWSSLCAVWLKEFERLTRGELISFIPLSLKGSEPSIKAEEEVTWKRGGGGNGAFFLQEVKGAENCQSACSRRRSCTHCSCRLNRRKRRPVLRFHISTQNSSRSKNQQPSSSPRKQGEIALIC